MKKNLVILFGALFIEPYLSSHQAILYGPFGIKKVLLTYGTLFQKIQDLYTKVMT